MILKCGADTAERIHDVRDSLQLFNCTYLMSLNICHHELLIKPDQASVLKWARVFFIHPKFYFSFARKPHLFICESSNLQFESAKFSIYDVIWPVVGSWLVWNLKGYSSYLLIALPKRCKACKRRVVLTLSPYRSSSIGHAQKLLHPTFPAMQLKCLFAFFSLQVINSITCRLHFSLFVIFFVIDRDYGNYGIMEIHSLCFSLLPLGCWRSAGNQGRSGRVWTEGWRWCPWTPRTLWCPWTCSGCLSKLLCFSFF